MKHLYECQVTVLHVLLDVCIHYYMTKKTAHQDHNESVVWRKVSNISLTDNVTVTRTFPTNLPVGIGGHQKYFLP